MSQKFYDMFMVIREQGDVPLNSNRRDGQVRTDRQETWNYHEIVKARNTSS
jgi:hypothetical protein